MARPFAMKLVFLALAVPALGQSPGRWMMDNPLSIHLPAHVTDPSPRFVTQPQDHFDHANGQTWQQAYFVNDTFWTAGSKAPVFLCVGGEGPPLDGSAVVSSLHCNVAVEWLAETKALMFALEHRYYGCHNMSACPVRSFADPKKSLRYLSSRQAIEDVANFVRQMNGFYKLAPENKWVTWGGSYPGMLAGWSRLKHPELIHAAVASSAPVRAKLDMAEYNDAVAHAFTVDDNGVGGSVACRDAIRRGHEMVEGMLERKGGVAAVEALLSLRNGSLATRAARQELLGNGLADFPAQGNDPTCLEPACNIKKICKVMLDAELGDELRRLLSVRRAQAASSGRGKAAPRDRRAALLDSVPDFWFYQTCTEFGFYQTCETNSSCMYVRGLVDVESMAAGCQEYDISVPDIAKNILVTNDHYGGLLPTGPAGSPGSCVLWPNGEVDPWATLSVLESPGPPQPVIWVPGASHHAWTHPTSSTDQPSVVRARAEIRAQVAAFLAQDCREAAQTQIVV